MTERQASLERRTGESSVRVELALDGSGVHEIATGVTMLDHMLSQLARHGRFDLKVRAEGDALPDHHHVVEDVAIALGRAFAEALGDRSGIIRMADATVPLDETLATVAVDLSGRGYAVVEAGFSTESIADLPADLFRHFLEAFAIEGRLNLSARVLSGKSDHHRAEALFKALARALDGATAPDPRLGGDVPSTKGVLR